MYFFFDINEHAENSIADIYRMYEEHRQEIPWFDFLYISSMKCSDVNHDSSLLDFSFIIWPRNKENEIFIHA